MKIHNVRLGFATNSSSSHSVILLPEDKQVNDDTHGNNFGWDYFTARNKATKTNYIGLQLLYSLKRMLPANIVQIILKDWVPGSNVVVEKVEEYEEYIDHQSIYLLPMTFGNKKFPDEQFFKEYRDFMLKPSLAILGGNDNDETKHPLGPGFEIPGHYDANYKDTPIVCRKDTEFNYWTIFNQANGSKIRFSFENLTNDSQNQPITKASTPELLDIKITNHCMFGCHYCYQGSTPEGTHAKSENFYGLIDALSQLAVFEVAIGGGEPTNHPDFVDLLRRFREAGIIPNFTTRNVAWLKDDAMRNEILGYIGAFAYSVDTPEQIVKLAKALDYHEINHNRCNLHIVPETMDRWTFERIIRTASEKNLAVTLLGYKETGFGKDFKRPQPFNWLSAVKDIKKKTYGPRISIDTVLAASSKQMLEEAEIPAYLYDLKDGKFSAYIDAVNMKFGPSSYCSEEEMVELPESRWDGEGMAEFIMEKFLEY